LKIANNLLIQKKQLLESTSNINQRKLA